MTEPALLERDAEVAELRTALEDARGGRGRLVVLEGPPGIGKTRLVRAAREAAADAGMRVLTARGSELERDFPFAVVRQLFEPALVAAEPAERDALLAGAARPAGPVVGVETGDAPTPGADPSFATLNALYWLVSNLVEESPALLAVDDAHWSDAPSLRFLSFLTTRLEDLPVLLLVAARPSADELVARVAGDPAALVLRPQALGETAVAALIREALPEASDAFCAACRETSGGNPFLLRELLAELVAEGRAGTDADAPHVREVAPESIARAVLVRLARLPPPARDLAHAVAILGDDAEPRLAAELAGLERTAAVAAADALAAAGVLETGRPLRFSHPLVRTTVRTDLPAGQRALAHERAAALLAQAGSQPERVAVHLLATDPAGDGAVVETLLVASARALDRAAPEAAVRYARRALAEPPPPERRAAVVRALAAGGFRAADPAALDGVDPLAELTADPETLIASAPTLAGWLAAGGRIDEMAELLQRAAATAAEAGDHDMAVRLEAQRVTWTHLPPAEARPLVEAHARHVTPGSADERLWLALQAWWTSFTPGAAAETAADLAERAIADGRIFAELPGLPQPAQAILVVLRAERFELAERAIEQLDTEARTRGATPEVAGAAYLRGELALRRGDVALAVAEGRAAVQAGRDAGVLAAIPIWLATLVESLVEHDEPDAAEAELAASGMAGPLPATYWFTPVLFARGRLRLAQGRWRDAADDLAAGAADLDRLGMVNSYVPWAALAAQAHAALDEPDRAGELLDRGLRDARAWGASGPLASTLRIRGLVEGDLALLAEAVAIAAPSPARLEHARALADHGAALRRANRRADAREPLRAALELARRGGAAAVARQARDELAATGERVRPEAAGGVESLTPSERRVADLAAEGLSNREIAQRLFLTVKTVETHLSSAYRKLGVRSRRELGPPLARV